MGALGEWKNEEDRAVGSRQTGWRIARGRGRSQGAETWVLQPRRTREVFCLNQ